MSERVGGAAVWHQGLDVWPQIAAAVIRLDWWWCHTTFLAWNNAAAQLSDFPHQMLTVMLKKPQRRGEMSAFLCPGVSPWRKAHVYPSPPSGRQRVHFIPPVSSLRSDSGWVRGPPGSGGIPEASWSPESSSAGQEESLHPSGGQSPAGRRAAGCRAAQRPAEHRAQAPESPVRVETLKHLCSEK